MLLPSGIWGWFWSPRAAGARLAKRAGSAPSSLGWVLRGCLDLTCCSLKNTNPAQRRHCEMASWLCLLVPGAPP